MFIDRGFGSLPRPRYIVIIPVNLHLVNHLPALTLDHQVNFAGVSRISSRRQVKYLCDPSGITIDQNNGEQ